MHHEESKHDSLSHHLEHPSAWAACGSEESPCFGPTLLKSKVGAHHLLESSGLSETEFVLLQCQINFPWSLICDEKVFEN
jgi:hypothetical protein